LYSSQVLSMYWKWLQNLQSGSRSPAKIQRDKKAS
jgi:hypothetical protein